MIQASTRQQVWDWRAQLEQPLALVPTMGFLHDGHLALVQAAKQAGGAVAVTIFVNPAQFGPNEDLTSYPRDLERDLSLLREAGVDLVWTPAPEVVYPDGYQTWIDVERVSQPLEGARRPGHFQGVATIVAKLFNLFSPAQVVLGQKDAQQVVVLRRMADDLDYPLRIVVAPTVREADGLAMSSRNSYLTEAERAAAPVLYRALSAAAEQHAAGEREAEGLRQTMLAELASEDLAQPEYVSAADPVTLLEIEGEADDCLLSMAVRLGQTRLIDNVLLGNTPLGG